jgi:hypothetical protein
VIFIRTGRWARRAAKGAWDVGRNAAGCTLPRRMVCMRAVLRCSDRMLPATLCLHRSRA